MSHASGSATIPSRSTTATQTHLSGRWLLLVRIGCGAGALLAVGPFTVDLMLRFAHLSRLTSFDVPAGWTPAAFYAALAQLGLSVGFYQVYQMVLHLLFVLCFFLVAALLLWRKSDEWMALLVALFLLNFGAAWPTNLDGLAVVYPGWSWLFTLANQLSLGLLLGFFFLFPDGRFVPRWMRWWWVVLVAGAVLSLFVPPLREAPMLVLAFFLFLASAVFAQIYRYRRRSSLLQRQQIKWAVFGFSATLFASLGFLLLGAIFPALGQPGTAGVLYELARAALGVLVFLPIPVCVGIALWRYRLWEIDALINKALVYGLLTALLAAIYVGLILGLQALVSIFTGQTDEPPLVIVLSTLAIAVLVLPVRRRVQRVIDRRFYRQNYDAEQTLAAFSATLREVLELEQVQQQLLAVVQETMQPAHVSLWLRQPARPPTELAQRLEPRGQTPTSPNPD